MAALRDMETRLKELDTAADVLQDDLQQQLVSHASYKAAHQAALEWAMDAQLKLAPITDLSGSRAEVKSRLTKAEVRDRCIF